MSDLRKTFADDRRWTLAELEAILRLEAGVLEPAAQALKIDPRILAGLLAAKA